MSCDELCGSLEQLLLRLVAGSWDVGVLQEKSFACEATISEVSLSARHPFRPELFRVRLTPLRALHQRVTRGDRGLQRCAKVAELCLGGVDDFSCSVRFSARVAT